MESYKQLVTQVLACGDGQPNRTGIDTIVDYNLHWQHSMESGLPILTTKKVNYRACIHELLWFLKGSTNIKYLTDNNVHIWDAWADENGDLGPVYGKQWTCSGPNKVDQVQYVINEIKNNPYSRRIILDAWNPSDMPDMALPPCHVLYQFHAQPQFKQLHLSVYMRSADMFLGVPFDIAEGGILLSLIAKITGYKPGMLYYTFGNAHIYTNHLAQIEKQLTREPFELPTLELPKKDSIYDYTFEDFNISGYQSHGFLKGEVAV